MLLQRIKITPTATAAPPVRPSGGQSSSPSTQGRCRALGSWLPRASPSGRCLSCSLGFSLACSDFRCEGSSGPAEFLAGCPLSCLRCEGHACAPSSRCLGALWHQGAACTPRPSLSPWSGMHPSCLAHSSDLWLLLGDLRLPHPGCPPDQLSRAPQGRPAICAFIKHPS